MRLDPIVIAPYDPSWPASFVEQRQRITPVLHPWLNRDIEHIGSTAVPGLPAKNIVDMLAVVAEIDAVRAAIDPLHELGWKHAPEPGDVAERRLSFCFPSVEYRSHHLHVVEERSPEWAGWLAFRDHLRAHDSVALDYATLKSQLAVEHGEDPDRRDGYRGGKATFIAAVTTRALAEGNPEANPH